MIYRMILATDHSEALGYEKGDPRGLKYDTGATYPGCCKENPDACDPRQFNSFDDAANYARSKGEKPVRVWSVDQAWKMVSDLNISCGQPAQTTVATPVPTSPTMTTTYNGGVSTREPIPPAIMPSLTPTPTSSPGGAGGPVSVSPSPQGTIYRLILKSPNGKYDTGATYPACTRSNPDGCQPMQFDTEKDAVEYALAHGETPVRVSSEEEAWRIVEGTQPVNVAAIISPDKLEFGINTFLLIGGLLALLGLSSRKKG